MHNNSEPTTRATISLAPSDLDALDEYADAHDITRSQAVRHALASIIDITPVHGRRRRRGHRVGFPGEESFVIGPPVENER